MVSKMVINSSGMEKTSQLCKIGGVNPRRPPNSVKNAESCNICVRRAAEPKMRRSPTNVRMLPEREWIELLQLQESLYAKRRRILYPEEKAEVEKNINGRKMCEADRIR